MSDARSSRTIGANLLPQTGLQHGLEPRGLVRLRRRWPSILQWAFVAGVASWFARVVLGHPTPFFVPVTVVISLGFSCGHCIRRALEVMAGSPWASSSGPLHQRVRVWLLAARRHRLPRRDDRHPPQRLAPSPSSSRWWRRCAAPPAQQARPALVRVEELSTIIGPSAALSDEVMRTKIGSMVVDLLTLTGLDQVEAVETVPSTHSAGEVSSDR